MVSSSQPTNLIPPKTKALGQILPKAFMIDIELNALACLLGDTISKFHSLVILQSATYGNFIKLKRWLTNPYWNTLSALTTMAITFIKFKVFP